MFWRAAAAERRHGGDHALVDHLLRALGGLVGVVALVAVGDLDLVAGDAATLVDRHGRGLDDADDLRPVGAGRLGGDDESDAHGLAREARRCRVGGGGGVAVVTAGG